MQERARPTTSYAKDEARWQANLRRSCPKLASQPTAFLVQCLRRSCIDVRRAQIERHRAEYRGCRCSANTVMTSPDLFSLIFSFLPQCLHTVILVGHVSKAWRNEVTTEPRTTANLVTAPFTIALLTTWQAKRLAGTWAALRWERCFGEAGEAAGQFYNPSCVLPLTEPLTGLKRLAVADTQNHRIQICDREGLPQLCSSPCLLDDEDGLPTPGLFNFPAALAHDDESLYVVDATGRLLQLRLVDLALVDAVGGRGVQDGQMFGAGGLAFAAGCIFVADNSNRRVAVWDTAPLRWRGVVGGGQGSGPGEISYPVDVAVHSAQLHPPPLLPQPKAAPCQDPPNPHPHPHTHQVHGLELFVADAENHRIMVFGLDGAFRRAFGGEGTAPGQFGWLSGVAVGRCGRLFVAEHTRLQVLTLQGLPLQVLHLPGAVELSQIRLTERHAFVVDETTHHVHVLTLDGACQK
jgi:hypothetical protein